MASMKNGCKGRTRREVLRDFALAGAGASAIGGGVDGLLARALAASPASGSLADIDHVVILMQENRSFDHYFGMLRGVRGFGDSSAHATFFQHDGGRTLKPFHLTKGCLPDLTHGWGPMHRMWNRGRMDQFLRVHDAEDGRAVGAETMGYYQRSDLRFYYALADAFMICDGYHCSALGPSDPNHLMAISATIDPDGRHGGPQLQTDGSDRYGRFSWRTMPESLEAHGVSWKVYTDHGGGGDSDNVLTYFKQYSTGSNLAARGTEPTFPGDFFIDLASDQLPQVSWLLPGLSQSEHPGDSTPLAGEQVVAEVLDAIVSRPETWARTAVFITWDENGGFFDHVAPPTPPSTTRGEFLTVRNLPPGAEGIRGPIGLGFRVPMLVVSPFSRGGLVCSQVFDHTSTLRFMERRFGATVPNLSPWRRRVTGDLTGAFNFAASPQYGWPSLPRPTGEPACGSPTPAAVPSQPFPRQERGTRRRTSGIPR